MLLLNTQFFNSYWIIVFPRFTAKQLNEQHYLASIQIHERGKKQPLRNGFYLPGFNI